MLVKEKNAPYREGVLKTLVHNTVSARSRMRREVASLGSLSAENIKVPKVYDDNTKSEDLATELYFVMEFIDGPTLKHLIEEKKAQTIDKSIAMTIDLCNTVAKAHKSGVVHRDIKPDNIIVRNYDSSDLVIVDYGLSFNHDDTDASQASRPTEQFRNSFLALPETNIAHEDHRDKRSDVTALCAIFFYLITGVKPGHLQDAYRKMPHYRPGSNLGDIHSNDIRINKINYMLDQGFAQDISQRYQTIEDFATDLQRLRSPLKNPC